MKVPVGQLLPEAISMAAFYLLFRALPVPFRIASGWANLAVFIGVWVSYGVVTTQFTRWRSARGRIPR